MAKDNLRQYDSTAANNADVGGVDTSEGMLPSKVNDAIRELMSHLADFQSGTEKVDAVAVDNLKLDGNTLSSTDTNGDITLDPNGTGNVVIGNYEFDADQSVGSGQDNYVLTYDNSSGHISLEEVASGGSIAPDQVFITSSGSETVPSGKTKARFIAHGAGGGGASRNADGSTGGTTTVTGTGLSLSAAGGAGGKAAYRALSDGSALPTASGGTINRKSGGGQGGQGSLPSFDVYEPQNGQDGALAEKIITVVPAATYTVTIGSGGSGGSGNVSDDGRAGENGFVIVEYYDE
jgi:hypothetical protein